MDCVQHIPIAHDLVLITVPRRSLFFKELLHAGTGGYDPFDFIGCFGALDLGDLHQTIQLHGLLPDKHILPALVLVDLCDEIQDI